MPVAASSLASVSIGVSGRTQAQSKFEVAPGRNVHVDLRAGFSADHIALAAKDAEIIRGILKDKPKEVQEIVSAVSAGKFKEAQKIAERIGITEDYFVKQGGGLWALVIVIAIGCALLLAHD
jgi:hypothetical protein